MVVAHDNRATWTKSSKPSDNPEPLFHPRSFRTARSIRFKDADAHAAKGGTGYGESYSNNLKEKLEDPNCAAGQIPFNNLSHLTDGSLVAGNPDVYYGARPEQLQQELRKQLSNKIEPSTQDYLPVVPNFFLQVKGSDGSLSVASRQAC
ncbi:hypothetical protein NOR_04613 [Metarhizium rileyi]|uniref:Uncharacterized protein n=1 Tax=Metarhizium rileyi (strain RCEF 4871) TaxID=1649241 RepID=A0A167E3K9_METRR|nr:hypothetical protein NOR_04613 [Metarhizium rileyi RCEF 4871]